MSILKDHAPLPEEVYPKFYKFGSAHRGTYFDLPDGPAERYGKGAKDLLDINWLSIEDLTDNDKHLNASQQRRIAAVLNPDLHRGVIGSKNVLNSVLGSVAEGKNYEKVCMCLTKSNMHSALGQVSCCYWKYCEKCASKYRQKYFKKFFYSMVDDTENFYHATLTYEEKLLFSSETVQDVETVWNELRKMVETAVDVSVISGALIFEELSVHSLYPVTTVNPHIHAIISSPHELALRVPEGVKICLKKIETEEHFRNVINYLPKAIELSEIYTREWTKENGRTVNQNLREVLGSYRETFGSRYGIKTLGRFSSKSKNTLAMDEAAYQSRKRIDPNARKGKRRAKKKELICNSLDQPLKSKNVKQKKKILFDEEKKEKEKFMGLELLGLTKVSQVGGLPPMLSQARDRVLQPAREVYEAGMNFARPLFDRSLREQNRMNSELGAGEIRGYNRYINNAKGSDLHGTGLSPTLHSPLHRFGENLASNPVTQAASFAPLLSTVATPISSAMDLPNRLASNPSLLSKLRMVKNRLIPGIGATAFGAMSVPDGLELGDWAADKLNIDSELGRNAARVGGVGASIGGVLAGGRLGAKIPGPPMVKALGGMLGMMAPSLFNTFRKVDNAGALYDAGMSGRMEALKRELGLAVRAKELEGNLEPLKHVLSHPEIKKVLPTS